MYAIVRYNKDGDIIKNPEAYQPKQTIELIDFLNEIYSRKTENFDQNNN